MRHPAIQQYRYHKWANDRVFEHLKSLPEDLYDNEIKSVFSSIRDVFMHMYQVDGMWLSVMAKDELSKTMKVIKQLNEKSQDCDLDGIRQLFEELNRQYEAFLGEHEDLDKEITIKHPHYGEMNTRVSELVKHVVNHGTYHRGNITAMLRQQGQKGVPTDYIFYLYENP